MKSSIKVDYGQSEGVKGGIIPNIKVVLEESDDVRDKLLKSFFEGLEHKSIWLTTHFEEVDDKKVITLRPLPPHLFKESIEMMQDLMEGKPNRYADRIK